jgi:hypothetical protein
MAVAERRQRTTLTATIHTHHTMPMGFVIGQRPAT